MVAKIPSPEAEGKPWWSPVSAPPVGGTKVILIPPWKWIKFPKDGGSSSGGGNGSGGANGGTAGGGTTDMLAMTEDGKHKWKFKLPNREAGWMGWTPDQGIPGWDPSKFPFVFDPMEYGNTFQSYLNEIKRLNPDVFRMVPDHRMERFNNAVRHILGLGYAQQTFYWSDPIFINVGEALLHESYQVALPWNWGDTITDIQNQTYGLNQANRHLGNWSGFVDAVLNDAIPSIRSGSDVVFSQS